MQTFWDFIWFFFWSFVFLAYLMTLFSVVVDLFRDHTLNGWWKAVWIIFLLFVPFLTVLVYVIARGRGMAERSDKSADSLRHSQEHYIREVAGAGSSHSPSDEITKAQALLSSGAITQAEFDTLKSHALAGK